MLTGSFSSNSCSLSTKPRLSSNGATKTRPSTTGAAQGLPPDKMTALLQGVIVRLDALTRDVAIIKGQCSHSVPSARARDHDVNASPAGSAAFTTAVHANPEAAQSAQQQLEYTLRTVYEQFAKFDADGSGALEPSEVREALNSIGTVDGRTVSDDDIAEVMSRYDSDGNGALDADEFLSFVRDLVLDGKFEFKEELQQVIEMIAMGTKEVIAIDRIAARPHQRVRVYMHPDLDSDAAAANVDIRVCSPVRSCVTVECHPRDINAGAVGARAPWGRWRALHAGPPPHQPTPAD